MSRRILIIGRSDIIFIIRLLQNIYGLAPSGLEIELYDNRHCTEDVNQETVPCRVYGVQMPAWCKRLLQVPVLRIFIRMLFEYTTLKTILRGKKYDAINMQELRFYSWLFLKCAHRHDAKVILTPIGSDALRVKGRSCRFLKKAFDQSDFVTITMGSGFAEKVIEKFSIDRSKIRDLSYGSDAISEIMRMKGHYSRKELAEMLHIPYSDYYICCGYNAYRAQNHVDMLKALAANAENLPKGCKILFPLGYGPGGETRKELEQENNRLGLDVVFMMDYLSPKEVAAQRLLTDLFIHIQTTDAHCFTMREFLLADTQVINGRWVSYPELEQYGVPYYVCDNKDALKDVLASFFKGELPSVSCSSELVEGLQQGSWNHVAQRWIDFYTSLK